MNGLIERLDSRTLLTTTLMRERTFGGDGIVKLDFGPTTVIRDAIPKSDNMVMVAGGLDDNLLVVRLRSNGKRDLSFGHDGLFRLDLNDAQDAVVSIESSGSGWILSTVQGKQVRITAKGKLDRAFCVRSNTIEADLLRMGYASAQSAGSIGNDEYFIGLAPTGRFEIVKTSAGLMVDRTQLGSQPLQDGPGEFDNWTPEFMWTTPKFFLTASGQLAMLAMETPPWEPNVNEHGVAKAYLWNLDATIATNVDFPSLAGINGSIVSLHQRSDGSVVFLQRDGNDNHTRVGMLSNDFQTFQDLGPLGLNDGPTNQSAYGNGLELVNDQLAIARGFENPQLLADGGGESLAIFDLDTRTREILRLGTEDRLISARTTKWNSEAVVYSKNRVALYTATYANNANQLVTATDGNDIIRIDQSGDTLIVNVNGKSKVLDATVDDSFEFVSGAPDDQTSRLILKIDAGAGKDKVIVNATVPVSIIGGSGRDTIYGGSGNDTIEGNSGDDLIFANGGADTVVGGTGFDNLFGGEGNDSIVGGSANDYLDGQAGRDSLYGDEGDDILVEYATGSIDQLFGSVGNDRAYHPESQDVLDSIEGEFVPPT